MPLPAALGSSQGTAAGRGCPCPAWTQQAHNLRTLKASISHPNGHGSQALRALQPSWQHSPPRRRAAVRTSVVQEPGTASSILADEDLPGVLSPSSGNGTSPTPSSVASPPPSWALSVDTDDDTEYDGIEMQTPKRATGLYVRVRGMVKHFRTNKGVFKAVDGGDVDVEPSSIVALLGPSGSGKTTLLRLIAGLETPTSGKIFFDDLDATNLTVQERQIGFVFQSYALFNHMTVADNVKFGLQVRNLPTDHDKRANDLLELVQLTGLQTRFPRQLSGGQRQRVALARALASNPRLLLLDEPFGALDAVVRKDLRAGLKEIVRSVGVTTIIVTHDQEEAFDLADKVVIFNRGLIEQQGTPQDIIRRPKSPFVMAFIGDTNVVPANCVLVLRAKYHTDKAKVMFRPSDIQLFPEYGKSAAPPGDGDGAPARERQLTPAYVADKYNLGWYIKYSLRFDDDVEIEFTVSREVDETNYNLDVGRRVYLYVSPKAMMGFDQHEIESAPVI